MEKLVLALSIVFLEAGLNVSRWCGVDNCLSNLCNSYKCSQCMNGFYIVKGTWNSRDWCKSCPSTCSACDGHEYCWTCEAGYYGPFCENTCTGCVNNICDKDSAACTSGCIDGYHMETTGTCSPCPSKCSQCDSSASCSACTDAYSWGATCQHTCYNCPICSQSDGCSSGCNGGFYREYNNNIRGYKCLKCAEKCTTCDSQYNCQSCNSNSYWGNYCQHTCNNCKTCSKSHGCSLCNTGYYRQYDRSVEGVTCKKCPETCLSCSGINNCQSCAQGFWGSACQSRCPDNCGECTSSTSCSTCETGHWGSYCQNSCAACKFNICNKSFGCTSGCIDGYFQIKSGNAYYCSKCIETCSTCLDSITCSSCYTGFAGSKCQFDCASCNGKLCNSITGQCTFICASDEYFKMDWSGQGCVKCPKGCLSCSSASQCTKCTTDKWGTKCDNSCPDNCFHSGCTKSNGYCLHNKCIDGYFGNTCTSKCLAACKSCTNSNSCLSCSIPGFFNYGQQYQKCECTTTTCSSVQSNVCLECTFNTSYPVLSGCCPCSPKCKENICSDNGSCVDCDNTKYGQNCDLNCPSVCKDRLCYRNGSCISCQQNWNYGPTCTSQCWKGISNCNRCNGQTIETVKCLTCRLGWYADGSKCTACSVHCISGNNPKCDPSTGECKGYCETGWFGERCNINCNVSNCQLCSDKDQNICNECNGGFYSDSNSSCISCPSHCLDGTICNKRSGTCSEGCNDKWSGKQCDIPCPSNCRQCDQLNKSSCSLCEVDFYGDSCEHTCNSGCAKRNQFNTCDKHNGTCNFDCKDHFWGTKCDKQCGEGCSENACNRMSGYCLSQCFETHFGKMCDDKCSENCNTTVGRSCNETNGYCLKGCNIGWFRNYCNETCSKNCKDTICDRNNGTCTSGCIDGYTGPMCMQALLKDESSNTAAIGGGAGAGVAVLVILVVIVGLVVFRRRKASSKMETRDGRSVAKNDSFEQTEPAGPEYSNITEARIEKESSEVPGVMNLVYANTAVRMSDVSAKNEVINAQTTPARPTSVDYLKEIEDDEDITVDDGEADANVVADDTYYNIGGQRVAVAKLAEYIKNKSLEDLLKDFEKIPKGLLKSYNEAKKSKNAAKNKYRAIYPYDENRVILQDGGSDYMNASYIDGYNRQKEYIASSGPFKRSYDTTSDFWRMIFQERCETLVMLTQPMEDGKTKCTKYWPDADESCQYGEIQITCLTEDVYADFSIRILTVTKDKETMNIRHVHFTAWPDKGIPHDVTSMIELRQKIRSLHKHKESPIIVHCSAGIGRTGTFIVLDMLTFEGEDRGSVDIFGSVVSLRNQRCNMVQTPEQYVYLHHAVLHSLTFDCRSIPGDMFLQNYNKMKERNGGERIIDKQFKQLQSISEEVTDEDRAQIQKNKALSNKNRKDADVPADEGRVKLHENRKPGASDYINAVYVNSFRRKRKFICAQTPLPSTVVDFLSLIQQERCTCIVSMEEPDINDKTVKVYWPADNQVVKHGVFKVSCNDSKTTAHYVSKKLSITYHGPNGEESQDVNLFIFTNWPKDSLVPKTSDSLLELVKTVDAMNRTLDYEAPILIHCRTGAERSCLYCAVSVLIEKMEIEHEVSVVNTLRQIKARRLSAISSVEQYKFCHQAVISYLQTFDIYSNFGLKEADA